MCHLCNTCIATSAVSFSDDPLPCLQVLASSQTDVGTRESKGRSEGKEGSGALGLTAMRRAMVEWSINLGGDASYSPLLVSLLSSPILSSRLVSSLLFSPVLLSLLSSRLSCPIVSPLFYSLLSPFD